METKESNDQFGDKHLICRRCGALFIFSGAEQKFFSEKGLKNEPKSCSDCRVKQRAERSGKGPESCASVACAQCGQQTVVPFSPKGHSPVYCGACYSARRRSKELQNISSFAEGTGGFEQPDLIN